METTLSSLSECESSKNDLTILDAADLSELSDDERAVLDGLVDPDRVRHEAKMPDDQAVQKLMAGMLLTEGEWAASMLGLVKPDCFRSEADVAMARAVFAYHNKYGKHPSIDIVKNEVRKAIHGATEDERRRAERETWYMGRLEEVRTAYLPNCESREYLADQVVAFARRYALTSLSRKILDTLKEGKKDAAAVAREEIERIERMGGANSARRPFVSVGAVLAMPPFQWAVRDIMPEQSVGVIWGEPGCLKSFAAIDLCCSLATGNSFLGAFDVTKPKRVAYVCSEGTSGLQKRLRVWMDHRGVGEDGLAGLKISTHSYMLDDPQDRALFLSELRDGFRGGEPPQVVVVDTLARNFGGDENATKELGKLINGLCNLSKEMSMSVVVIHHAGKDRQRGPRGNTVLLGAVDWSVEMQKEADSGERRYKARIYKQKDGEESDWFEVVPSVVPAGDAGTSLVVAKGGAAPTARNRPVTVQDLVPILGRCLEPRTLADLKGDFGKSDKTLDKYLDLATRQGFLEKIPGNRTKDNPNRWRVTVMGEQRLYESQEVSK